MFSRLSPYWLWALLALPALRMIAPLFGKNALALRDVIHPSGELAARLLIVTMMATPLLLLTKGSGFARWFFANRRHFGMASFGYAALHTLAHVLSSGSWGHILRQATRLDMLAGWLAFAIFIPLAATSMDYAVRRLGTRWKPIQRLTYPAAVLVLLHWAAMYNWSSWLPAAVHFAPLAGLELYRLWWLYLRDRPKPT